MSDAELLTESFSSKANRTRVYSGNRTAKAVPSLFEMCIRVLQENIEFLESTGGVPFDILRPVLERAKPEQLCNIEYYNQYLIEESDVLWEPHCKRKFRTRKRLEMESWREMYERCTTEDEEKLSRLTQNIKQNQETTSNGVQKTMLAFVDSMVKPPRNVMRKQEIFGTNRKLVVSAAARTVGLKNIMPNLAAPGDARLRVAAGIRDDAHNSEFTLRNESTIAFFNHFLFLLNSWSRISRQRQESSNDGKNLIKVQALKANLHVNGNLRLWTVDKINDTNCNVNEVFRLSVIFCLFFCLNKLITQHS
jgi:transcription elongation factor B polypeptide 3